MNIDLGKSTNKGTALIKFAHQFLPDLILEDQYVGWFFDEAIANALQQNPFKIGVEPTNEIERFQQVVYEYIILREKHGDQVITEAITAGCQQLLLLGSGYDTRFFRLPTIQNRNIATFEVDLPNTIEDKQKDLLDNLGQIPQGLTLIPLDFNHHDLNNLLEYNFNPELATIYVWQGVSYYLPQESVSQVLDFIKSKMTPNSILIFDCCSPLMIYKNDQVPGISASIDKLTEIGEPYLFGMYADQMKVWLEEKGFQTIEILQQDDLEEQILHKRTLPNNMWYVVVAKIKMRSHY